MTKIMTATEMTDGQIENVVNKLRDAMRKHRSEIDSDVAQQVLGVSNLGMEMFVPFRKHVEMISNMIIRHVKVDRSRTPQQALYATGRKQYVDDRVVDVMPRGKGEELDVFFFNPGRHVSDGELEKEFDVRGFKPADPYSLAQVNIDDPAFADTHPNGTHWKNAKGNWCYAAFNRWYDERHVRVREYVFDWNDRWWFAGVRK